MKQSLLFVLIYILFMSSAFAQQEDLSLYLFANISEPFGDFGKNFAPNTGATRRTGYYLGDKVGLAQMGYGIGAELISPIWFKGMRWVFSTKMIVNGVDDKAVTADFSSWLGDTVDVAFDFGHWYNIPVMTGFRYDHHFSHRYTIYTIVLAGVNISKAPSKRITTGEIEAENTKYEVARDFGYEIGLGFMLDQTFNVGFRYLQLGTPRYDGTQTLSGQVFPGTFRQKKALLGEERSVSMFLVTLGVQLFK